MRRHLVLITVATLALSACGGGANSTALKSSTTRSISTSSTPTASAATTKAKPTGPSLRQVASMVALEQASMKSSPKGVEKNCSAGGMANNDSPAGMGPELCAGSVSVAHSSAQLAVYRLSKIKHAPAEVSDLLASTIEAAKRVSGVSVKGCTIDSSKLPTQGACETAYITMTSALGDLEQQFAAWKPYGV